MYVCMYVCIYLFKGFLSLYLERVEGREKERERNIYVWLPWLRVRFRLPSYFLLSTNWTLVKLHVSISIYFPEINLFGSLGVLMVFSRIYLFLPLPFLIKDSPQFGILTYSSLHLSPVI